MKHCREIVWGGGEKRYYCEKGKKEEGEEMKHCMRRKERLDGGEGEWGGVKRVGLRDT